MPDAMHWEDRVVQTELGGRILNDALPEPIQRLAPGTAVRVTVEPLTPTPAPSGGTMPRCRTCKHFRAEPAFSYPEPDYDPVVVWPGWCAAMRGPFDDHDKATWPSAGRMAITVDGSTYKADLLVTPDFGCVLHEETT